jgi:hypothetical protein
MFDARNAYWYALTTHLARPITHADRRSLHEADARCRRQREQPFIRHANRGPHALQNAQERVEFPDFMNDIVAATIMK